MSRPCPYVYRNHCVLEDSCKCQNREEQEYPPEDEYDYPRVPLIFEPDSLGG